LKIHKLNITQIKQNTAKKNKTTQV